MANGQDTIDLAVTGRQHRIRGTGTVPDAADPSVPALLAGVTLASGTYYYSLNVTGSAAIDVVLRASASTGTGLSTAATIYPTLSDGSTQKGATVGTFATFVVGTQQVVSNSTLRGERIVILKLVVPVTSSVTFDQAEYSTY